MSPLPSRSLWATLIFATIGMALGTGGCTAKPDASLQALNFAGDYGRAREQVASKLGTAKKDADDRDYLLTRMRFALATMSDGYCSDDPVFDEVYETLSQHGINKGKEVESALINEDLKKWKGEPFEQAIMLSYLSMYYAMQGSWDNARAAASSSQFRLMDFGNTKEGKRRTNEDIVREAAADETFFNNYQARETDFAFGILLDAIANQQIGRTDEAASKFNVVKKLRPELSDLIQELSKGDYQHILVVSWGQGPQKIGTGPDQAIASWAPQTRSSNANLVVNTGGGGTKAYPLVCDVNVMAQDHMWNNMEDWRRAKSLIGNVLLVGGTATAVYGAQREDSGTAIAGVAIALAGAALKAGSHADTRYCDIMPQRFYVVPIKSRNATTVDLEVEGYPVSRLTLAELKPPAAGKAANLRYVNLVTRANAPPQWATSGQIFYDTDALPTEVAKPWPYILGGDCVRKPTQNALDYYQKNGYLTGMTVDELQNLYRQERIVFDGPAQLRTRHVLEGGKSIEAPLPGTAGFARLFGQPHSAYAPKSPDVAFLAGRIKSQAGPTAVTAAGP